MRENWTYKKLGEVCAPKTDILRANKLFRKDDVIEYIDISSIDNCAHRITQPTRFLFYEAPSRAQQKVEQGDILYSLVRPNLKNIAVVTSSNTDKYVASSGFCVLRSKEVDNRYLYHLVLSNPFYDYILGLVSGANYPAVREEDIKGFSFRCPPLSEQQSIVAELDKINELISLKKTQLSDLDALAQSIFYDMFGDPIENEKGWEVKKLGEMSSVKTGPFGSMLHKEDYISNGIPLVNPIHIKDYRVIADMDFTISDEKARELNAYILRKNDVIFARRGDIGRCAVISDKENGYLCGTGSLFVRFEQKVIPQYIMYIIRSSSFIKELISKAKGATMLNLNSTTIASLGIPLPPLPLQQEFAKRIELIEQQKAQISSTIKDLETLLASRMQYWFD